MSREMKETSDSTKPKYSRFTQQELPACRLLFTPALVIPTLFIIGGIFIPIGVVSLLATNQVVEVAYRYDDYCIKYNTNEQGDALMRTGQGSSCRTTINITQTMDPPIYIYYQLTNFYQNYRRYLISQCDVQLAGDNVTSQLGACAPEDYVPGSNSTLPIRPCGLIAWSLFNDTFGLSIQGSASPLVINSSDISWPSDRNKKFGPVPPQNFNNIPATRGGATINTTLNNAQNLQVWMRTAAFPTFRKLYGQINTTLPAGTNLTVSIANLYNSYAYEGTKSFVISTTTWLGGKNSFSSIAYLAVGGICFVLSIVFFILEFTNYRPLDDTSYLSWNRKAAALREAAEETEEENLDKGIPEEPVEGNSG